MNHQDELAQDIRAVDGNHSLGAAELAERLTERGWSRPRVVRIHEELESLPVGTLARNDYGHYCIRREDGWTLVNESSTRTVTMWLPATVLYLPEETP